MKINKANEETSVIFILYKNTSTWKQINEAEPIGSVRFSLVGSVGSRIVAIKTWGFSEPSQGFFCFRTRSHSQVQWNWRSLFQIKKKIYLRADESAREIDSRGGAGEERRMCRDPSGERERCGGRLRSWKREEEDWEAEEIKDTNPNG